MKLTAVFEPFKEGGYTCFMEEIPAAISQRSVKHTVTGFTPHKTIFPLLKLTFFAFCTKRTSTFFDCLPPAVQVISDALVADVGGAAYVVNGFVTLSPANAPDIRMSLFIFIRFLLAAGLL